MAALQCSRGTLLSSDSIASTSGRCTIHNASPVHSSRSGPARGGRRCQALGNEFGLWRGELPADYTGRGVVPGARTLATPILTPERVFQRMGESVHPKAGATYGAFYSSELGGIVTSPAFMLVHVDDHMVHRGHGVFDTVSMVEGHLYQLDEHVARLQASAEATGIPMPMTDTAIKRILLDTAAASMKLNGRLKVWLGRGRGGFGLSETECYEPSLYAVATSDLEREGINRIRGWAAGTAVCDPLPPYFAGVCSPNYLQHVLAQMEAESRGMDTAIFTDAEDCALEFTNGNLAIVTPDDVLVYPPFEGNLPGITIQRLADLVPQVANKRELPIRAVEQRRIPVDEAFAAKEVMCIGSAMGVVGIHHWDEVAIGDGKPGAVANALYQLLLADMDPERGDPQMHTAVPYGYLTGMKDQLV